MAPKPDITLGGISAQPDQNPITALLSCMNFILSGLDPSKGSSASYGMDPAKDDAIDDFLMPLEYLILNSGKSFIIWPLTFQIYQVGIVLPMIMNWDRQSYLHELWMQNRNNFLWDWQCNSHNGLTKVTS